MQSIPTPPAPSMIARAERLLSDRFDGLVRFGDGIDLSSSKRSLVYRFPIVEGSHETPASVIVKVVNPTEKAPYDPAIADTPAWTLFNEWAALQFLQQVPGADGLAPRLYAADKTAGMLIIEDLGEGRHLDSFLLGNDAKAAEQALLDFAIVHGRLHALTMQHSDEFASLRESLGPNVWVRDDGRYTWIADVFHTAIATLDITSLAGVDQELEHVKEALAQPGPFRTFIQGDSCLDNCLYTPKGLYLIDFEGAIVSHALREGLYGRMHFPTCWCVYRLPELVIERMEQAYRAELIKGCPEAADDALYYRAVVDVCAFWVMDGFHTFSLSKLLQQDRWIVAASDRQRFMTRATIFVRTAEQLGYLPALCGTMRTMLERLHALWGIDETAMAYYPAFADEYSTHAGAH